MKVKDLVKILLSKHDPNDEIQVGGEFGGTFDIKPERVVRTTIGKSTAKGFVHVNTVVIEVRD